MATVDRTEAELLVRRMEQSVLTDAHRSGRGPNPYLHPFDIPLADADVRRARHLLTDVVPTFSAKPMRTFLQTCCGLGAELPPAGRLFVIDFYAVDKSVINAIYTKHHTELHNGARSLLRRYRMTKNELRGAAAAAPAKPGAGTAAVSGGGGGGSVSAGAAHVRRSTHTEAGVKRGAPGAATTATPTSTATAAAAAAAAASAGAARISAATSSRVPGAPPPPKRGAPSVSGPNVSSGRSATGTDISKHDAAAVSYTHLTLPTIYSV